MRISTWPALLLSSLILLGGCGGDAAPGIQSPEGAYSGTTSNGSDLLLLVLPDGVTWGLYGKTVYGVFLAEGFMHGTRYTYDGTRYDTDFIDYSNDGSTGQGTLKATYVHRVSITGVVTEGDFTTTFTNTATPPSGYVYDQPADLGLLTGFWNGLSLSGTLGSLFVDSTGLISGNLDGCSLAGHIAPVSSGKNAFAVEFQLGSEQGCAHPQLSLSGHAVNYMVSGTNSRVSQLVLAATSPESEGSTVGVAFIAQRNAP